MRHNRPAAELAEAGQTPVAVAVNGQLRLLLGVADALRPDSPHGWPGLPSSASGAAAIGCPAVPPGRPPVLGLPG